MNSNREFRAAFGLLLASALFAALAHPQQQSKQPPKAAQARPLELPSKHSGPPPLADLGAASTESPAEQTRRQTRESRFRGKYFFGPISDPGRFVDGREESPSLVITDYAGRFEPFPASVSAAVIVGTVMSGRGHVTFDRSHVYSDFRIRVDEILKQDQQQRFAIGEAIVASRIGATVRFPSGHTKSYVHYSHGMPKIGAQYLLFLLRPDATQPEYWICTGAAYELREGKGFPLDDYQPALEGIDSGELLDRARKATSTSLR